MKVQTEEHMILTSKHYIDVVSNRDKLSNLSLFIDEYRRVASLIIYDIWDNGYFDEDKNIDFHPKKNKFVIGSFIDYNRFNTIETFLSARALSSLVTQICGMLKSSTEKQRKRIHILNKRKSEGSSKTKLKQLVKKLKQNIPQKPTSENINLELSSKCIEFIKTDKFFEGFLRIKSFTKDKKEIYLPIKFHKHSKKLKARGQMLNSFLISKDRIDVRWEIPVSMKTEGNIVGADQGIKTVLTCSDGQKTDDTCPHGHSIDSVMDRLSRKKKGSKSFKRSQDHRKNIINYFLNKIDFKDVKELRFEHIWNIGYKNSRSRKLGHWTNTIIRDKVERLALQNGVRFTEQNSTYRSQRCSDCGNVRKANRKGKIYSCHNCGTILDADYNAALNHSIDLPEIPYALRKKNLNRKQGFFWNHNGFYDFSGRSLESLPHVKDNVI